MFTAYYYRISFLFLVLILACWIGAPSATGAENEQRVALVIGNADYESSPLNNPVNDAQSMADTLEKSGFEVIVRLNADRAGMREAVRLFADRIKKGGIGLFFYAGHGIQYRGFNYLVPVDAKIKRRYDIEDQCLKASYVLGAMEDAGNRLNIIILDACRNNPFRSFRDAGTGLAEMKAPTGSILAYATAPGRTADDGSGGNGLYTSMLLKHMLTPGLTLESVFKRVRKDVQEASNGAQIPWESTSLTGEFFFIPAEMPATGITWVDEVHPDQPGSKTDENKAAPEIPSVDFGDLEKKAKQRDYWQKWQVEMERAWDKAEALETNEAISPTSKAEAWKRVMEAFKDDNPFTDRDEELRTKGIARREFWLAQNEKPPVAPEPDIERQPVKLFKVVRVRSWDVLWIRSQPNPNSGKIGKIPYNGVGIEFLGQSAKYGKRSNWVKIRYGPYVGWCNAYYLMETK